MTADPIAAHDQAARTLFSVVENLNCPKCHEPLTFTRLRTDIFPYTHADLTLHCHPCDLRFLFGIPTDALAGMLFYHMTGDIELAYEAGKKIHRPLCPFHREPMRPTKFWQSTKESTVTQTMQFKCSKCFLIKHVNIPSSTPQ